MESQEPRITCVAASPSNPPSTSPAPPWVSPFPSSHSFLRCLKAVRMTTSLPPQLTLPTRNAPAQFCCYLLESNFCYCAHCSIFSLCHLYPPDVTSSSQSASKDSFSNTSLLILLLLLLCLNVHAPHAVSSAEIFLSVVTHKDKKQGEDPLFRGSYRKHNDC